MIFLDVNTFYGPKAGGIRTYHQQKIAWFKEHPEHTYILVGSGAEFSIEELAPNVTYIRLYGLQMTSDPDGYRVMLDMLRLKNIVQKYKPDVVEAGDPWLTGIFCILLKFLGFFRGQLSSFYHSDPIRTYFEPWAHKGKFSFIRRSLVALVRPVFFFLQRRYDLTLTASKVMKDYLDGEGVLTAMTPFGAPALFFDNAIEYQSPDGVVKLLYAGRLDQEKGIETLIEALPEILASERIQLTVVGRGAYDTFFQTYENPNYKFGGYVRERSEFLMLLQTHHLMIAPGPYETFALGVLEAMAVGLPVVGPDRGGTAELLSQVSGAELFKSEDPEDLTRVIQHYLSADLLALSLAHQKVAQDYGTWDRCFSNMVRIYEERVPQ